MLTPAISGREADIQAAMAQGGCYWLEHSPLKLDQRRSAFACALHMHQPTIPAGADGALISPSAINTSRSSAPATPAAA